MAIDVVFLVLMIMALFKGLRRGLIVAVFSLVGLILGLAAAIKLSAIVAQHLNRTVHLSAKWLPILAFLAVFIGVVLLVRWAANLLEAAVSLVLMEWLNKLGAVVLYAALYIAIFSVLLFYGRQSGILTTHAMASSKVYGFVEPWGPAVINGLAKAIPLFKGMFAELEVFFGRLSHRLS
jgi:membrane protein required for colicin V production